MGKSFWEYGGKKVFVGGMENILGWGGKENFGGGVLNFFGGWHVKILLEVGWQKNFWKWGSNICHITSPQKFATPPQKNVNTHPKNCYYPTLQNYFYYPTLQNYFYYPTKIFWSPPPKKYFAMPPPKKNLASTPKFFLLSCTTTVCPWFSLNIYM